MLGRLCLVFIILLASGLYFFRIGELPNSLSDDEAAVGYNAYSILDTGKDEFGKSFPIAFRFFGAYTPPLYVYLLVPVIRLFGLSTAAIRIPSGVSTLVGIVITYYFVRILGIFKSAVVPLLGATVFAVSPWVVYYARIGYEVTFGYIVFSLGVLLLWNGISKNKLSLLGLTLLSISSYVAHTERYLVPLFLIFVIISFRKKLVTLNNRSSLIRGTIVLAMTQLPNLYLVTTNAFWVKNSFMANTNIGQLVSDFISQMLTYYSPKEIFGISSDINLQHTAPEIGLFYSWLIVPFLAGLYQLYRKLRTPGGKFLAIWLLTTPIPGALSGHFVSIQRVLPLIIPLVLVTCLGFDFFLRRMRPLVLVVIFVLLSAFSLLLLWRSYFVLFPRERFPYWSYGYQQLAEIVRTNHGDHFVIDSTRANTVYAGFLFYLKFPPSEYQKRFSPELVRSYYDNLTNDSGYQFGNLELRSIIWKDDVFKEQILVGDALAISTDQAKEHFLEKIFEIKDPNGKAILFGYRTDPAKKKAENLAKERTRSRGKMSK